MTNKHNTRSTDLDRNFSDYADDPEQTADVIKLLILVVNLIVFFGTAIIIVFARQGFFDNV